MPTLKGLQDNFLRNVAKVCVNLWLGAGDDLCECVAAIKKDLDAMIQMVDGGDKLNPMTTPITTIPRDGGDIRALKCLESCAGITNPAALSALVEAATELIKNCSTCEELSGERTGKMRSRSYRDTCEPPCPNCADLRAALAKLNEKP